MNSPTSPSDRYDRGDTILAQIDGSDGQAIVDSLGDLGRYLVEFGFGDVYARPGLPLRDRELITVAMLAAMQAHESQLDGSMTSMDSRTLEVRGVPVTLTEVGDPPPARRSSCMAGQDRYRSTRLSRTWLRTTVCLPLPIQGGTVHRGRRR